MHSLNVTRTSLNEVMKERLVQSRGYTSKSVTFSAEEGRSIPWLREVREMDVNYHYVTVQPPFRPIVGVGRAFINHLKKCGVLDGFDADEKHDPMGITHLCKLSICVDSADDKFHLSAEFGYGYRPERPGSSMCPSEKELTEFLYGRVVKGDAGFTVVEMKLNYALVLKSLVCHINDLELVV